VGDGLAFDATGDKVALQGELDLAGVGKLRKMLAAYDDHAVELDLGGLTFIDSSGLRALITARDCHRGLRIVNIPASVTRLLELTGTTELLLDAPAM
jgi:anti-sigma B factor antagonist